MTTIGREIIDSERDGFHATVAPNDAATLIVIDRTAPEPTVLLGRRHKRHVFLPGKFVFPGGRVDAADRTMPVAKPMSPDMARKLIVDTGLRGESEARALALAAIRETFEETGLVIGAKGPVAGSVPPGPWTDFVQTGYYPDLSVLHFIARAITPPGFPRRFDARFFCVDRDAVTYRLENVVHSDAELVELTWLPITAARNLDLPVITRLVLEELQSRQRAGSSLNMPVPFYCTRDGEFTRELIE